MVAGSIKNACDYQNGDVHIEMTAYSLLSLNGTIDIHGQLSETCSDGVMNVKNVH